MSNFDGQLNRFREQAAQAGFSGTGIMDVHPSIGVIRLKLSTVPPETLKPFTQNFSQALAMMLGGMNVQVKIHVEQQG